MKNKLLLISIILLVLFSLIIISYSYYIEYLAKRLTDNQEFYVINDETHIIGRVEEYISRSGGLNYQGKQFRFQAISSIHH